MLQSKAESSDIAIDNMFVYNKLNAHKVYHYASTLSESEEVYEHMTVYIAKKIIISNTNHLHVGMSLHVLCT